MDEVLKHYGVLGMKWGVRRTPAQSGQKTKRKSVRFKSKAKRIARNTAAFIGSSVVMTVAVNTLLNNSTRPKYVYSGKQYTNSYIKKNSKEKVSDVETNKSWADYAWEEVRKN